MEEGQLSQNLNPNEVPEENIQNDMNTEENVIYTPQSSTNPVPIDLNQNNYNVSSNIYMAPNPNMNNNVTSSSNPSNTKADTNTVWYDLSILSWFLFLCTGWNLFKESSAISLPVSLLEDLADQSFYKPLCTNLSLIMAITSSLSTIGFILYFRNVTLNKNQNFISGLLGDMSKYHSIPLLLVSGLFMSLTNAGTKGAFVFSLIFSLLSFVSLFFIYLKLDFQGEWYEIITIKKGAFSCLIAITWYTLFFSFASLGVNKDLSTSFIKGTGIAFSLLVGIGNLGFCFFFKDLMVGIINAVLYIEMAKFFYTNRGKLDVKADGVIDIIMVLLSFGLIFYLYFKERESLYRA
jgi:hypothetical protein